MGQTAEDLYRNALLERRFGRLPRWESEEGYYIEVSMEPSGLQFFAKMPEDKWRIWIAAFKEKATAALGYEIGEPEDGFEFRYYE